MSLGIGAIMALQSAGSLISSAANLRDASKNRSFQQRMSNTAYQRSVKDMKLAGINPMLAYMKGGASTPSGSTGKTTNPLEQISTTALQYKKNKAEVANLESQNSLIQSQTEKTNAEKLNIQQNLGLKDPAAQLMEILSSFMETTRSHSPTTAENTNTAIEKAKEVYKWGTNIPNKLKQFMQKERKNEDERRNKNRNRNNANRGTINRK